MSTERNTAAFIAGVCEELKDLAAQKDSSYCSTCFDDGYPSQAPRP